MIRINTILFPTDFSPSARQALDHALFLAREFDADLHMFHAVALHQDDPGNPDKRFLEPDEVMARLEEVAESEMALLARHPRGGEVRIHRERRRGYAPGPVILDYAEEVDADLVVMGTHGHRGPAHFFLGSVAEEIVRAARCPVLTSREREEEFRLEAISDVLAPVDFSEHSVAGVRAAKEMAAVYQARIRLVHVVEVPALPSLYGGAASAYDPGEVTQEILGEMERIYRQAGGGEAEYDRTVLTGQPSHEIVRFAGEEEADLVVIPTHGLTGIERLLLGSTAESVIRRAPCPVLSVKAFGKQWSDPDEA